MTHQLERPVFRSTLTLYHNFTFVKLWECEKLVEPLVGTTHTEVFFMENQQETMPARIGVRLPGHLRRQLENMGEYNTLSGAARYLIERGLEAERERQEQRPVYTRPGNQDHDLD